MKKNNLIFLFLLGIFFSAWNTPYINTDETLELKYGMSKSSVLDVVGLPLYVEKGWPNGKSNEIIWVYEVRTTEVESKKSKQGQAFEIVKSSSSKRPGSKHHRLKLTFKDNKLINWEPIDDEEVANISIDLEVLSTMPDISNVSISNETSSDLSIQPKISIISESWEIFDDWGYDTSGGGFRLGVVIGKPMFGMNVGLDVSFGDGVGFMLFVDREMFGLHWIASFGKDTYTYDPGNGGSYDAEGGLKLAVFKDLKMPISIGLETINRSSSWWNYDLGSGTFLTIKYRMR